MSSSNIRLPRMGSASKHPHFDQCSNWSITEYHMGLDIMDCRFCYWFHSRRSTIGHIRTPLVLHRSFSIGTDREYHWSKRPEHQHADCYKCTHSEHQSPTKNCTNHTFLVDQRPCSCWPTFFPYHPRRTRSQHSQRSRQRLCAVDFRPVRRLRASSGARLLRKYGPAMAMVLHPGRHRQHPGRCPVFLLLPPTDL